MSRGWCGEGGLAPLWRWGVSRARGRHRGRWRGLLPFFSLLVIAGGRVDIWSCPLQTRIRGLVVTLERWKTGTVHVPNVQFSSGELSLWLLVQFDINLHSTPLGWATALLVPLPATPR